MHKRVYSKFSPGASQHDHLSKLTLHFVHILLKKLWKHTVESANHSKEPHIYTY